MDNRGAVANRCRFEHVELFTGKGDERACADGLLFHEGDCFRTLDRHDGIDEIEGCIEATTERVDLKDYVVGLLLDGFADGSRTEFVHGGVNVAFELDPDRLFLGRGNFGFYGIFFYRINNGRCVGQ